MFKKQLADIRAYNEESNGRFRQLVVENKMMEQLVRKEYNEHLRIIDEFKKINRTGRQPGSGRETKKKR